MNLVEIPASQYGVITPLLGEYAIYPVVNAVIEGNAAGRIFVDNLNNPQSAFVLTLAGFSYLLGASQNEAFNLALKEQLEREIFPEILASDDPTLIVYPLADGWDVPLKQILAGDEVYELFRTQFTFNPQKFARHARQLNPLPAGFQLQQINRALLERFDADMFPWKSPEIFLKNGLGFWILAGDEIACECSAVFAGGGALEINIHTDEKYQRRGFAATASTAFVAECLKRGVRPNWECWWENEPSISLAQKLGFEPVKEHPVFLVELK